MSNQPEYKPCPFCGGEACKVCLNTVNCLACGVELERPTYGEAKETWNTRAPVPEPEPAEALHGFTCPEPGCGGHSYGLSSYWHFEDQEEKVMVHCHDQHGTRCNWSGPYALFVRPDSSSQGSQDKGNQDE